MSSIRYLCGFEGHLRTFCGHYRTMYVIQSKKIKEVNTDMNWKHAGDTGGTAVGGNEQPVTLPTVTIRELLIIAMPDGGFGNSNTMPRYTLHIPYEYLTDDYQLFCAGHSYTPYQQNAGSVGIHVSKRLVSCNWASHGTDDASKLYFLKVYYR